ncbi:MAG: ATP-binding cassette domain-containing protein [Clostridia bacterium]|nr:ATP-binding cassette domain-containing protein [Clostridia bacterium]
MSLNRNETPAATGAQENATLKALKEYYLNEAPFAIQMTGVKKEYQLGQFSSGTLINDVRSWWARKHGRDDPNTKVENDGRVILTDRFLALDDINLEIKHGETVGLIGANGAGKSTLLKLLSRVTAPTAGRIEIYGRVASMLEVGTGFNRELTGRENIYMNGTILGMTKSEIDRKMDAIIDFSEIGRYIDTPVKRYSSGMYVKLAFAVAANLDAEIMIMDEVLAVGDMAFQKKCIEKMRGIEQERGKTILYVSHNMDTIKRLCERCIVLKQGKIIFDGPANEAIALYMGINRAVATHYDYPESSHARYNFRKALIESADFPASFNGQIPENATLSFRVAVLGKLDLSEMYLRLEIVNSYGTVIGVMNSERGVPLKKNARTHVSVVMNCAHLAPGNYQVNLVAEAYTASGEWMKLDAVDSAFSLEIAYNAAAEEQHAHWFAVWNSSVNLEPLQIAQV